MSLRVGSLAVSWRGAVMRGGRQALGAAVRLPQGLPQGLHHRVRASINPSDTLLFIATPQLPIGCQPLHHLALPGAARRYAPSCVTIPNFPYFASDSSPSAESVLRGLDPARVWRPAPYASIAGRAALWLVPRSTQSLCGPPALDNTWPLGTAGRGTSD